MSNRSFAFAPDIILHIYNRGNSKQDIFLDDRDYQRFITLLFIANSTKSFKLFFIKEPFDVDREDQLVSIAAYCLMPNHFHILIKPVVEDGVSLFMKKISTGYSMYFNNRYKRTGSLFEGKFKAELVDEDVYLKYLYSYIHLNPIKLIQHTWKEKDISDKKKAKEFIKAYAYSSYKDYAGESRKEGNILNIETFPEYFDSPSDFKRNIFEWFEENKQVFPV